MKKYTDDVNGRLLKELPLKENEDGVLVVIDREKWEIRVFYEGNQTTLDAIDGLLETAKEMFRIPHEKVEEEIKEEILN